MINLPISIGEALDKFSILELKLKYITDKTKLVHVTKEYELLNNILYQSKLDTIFFYNVLFECNEVIWHLCDKVRDKTNPDYLLYCDQIITENDNRVRIKNKINNILLSTTCEQKSYNKKKLCILGHLSIGDTISIIGAIRFLSFQYDEIILFCLHKHFIIISSFFKDDPSIIIKPVKNKENAFEIIESLNDYQIELLGYQKSQTLSTVFFKQYYLDLNLPFDYHFKYFYIHHNTDVEDMLYNEIIKYNHKYIFVHDNIERNDIINFSFLDNRNVLIFHPNRNYYENQPNHKYYNVWTNMHNNIVDYSKIIINASELYLIDSSISCLAIHLNVNANIKVIWKRCNLNSYFTSDHSWKIRTDRLNNDDLIINDNLIDEST